MRLAELFSFIQERHSVYNRKIEGRAKPWTQDPILQKYKFCNIYRELDTVTIWIRKQWREPFADHPNLWFAMAMARVINWPDTLQEVGFPKTWDPEKARQAMLSRSARGEKTYTGAYMLRGDIQRDDGPNDKPLYTCFKVLDPLWQAKLKTAKGETLDSYHGRLAAMPGWGSFLAAQVVCDLKYTKWLAGAEDWWTFAASGPGSQRGMNRMLKRPLNASWREVDWRDKLAELQAVVDPLIKKAKLPRLHAQDLQNCLCEFDKYERVRLGEGRPRSLYPGS